MFVVKVWYLLKGHTYSVVLKSFSGEAVEAKYPSKTTYVASRSLRVNTLIMLSYR